MNRKDWTLLVLAAAKGKPLTPVQLQKTLFLLGQQLPDATSGDYYRFTPYHYGPFDSTVYDDARDLRDEGLAVITQSSRGRWSEYAATPATIEEAGRVRQEIDAKVASYIEKLVEWVQSLSFEDLLRSVYAAYPEMKERSVFRG